MKKYKHKLTGDIAIKSAESYFLTTVKYNTNIPANIIENSNDWEEIIEKDYEILSFVDISKLVKKEDGLFYRENTQNKGVREDQISHFRINSVKRLSDGETFTLSDKVKQSNVIHNNTFTITGFEFDVNKEHLLAVGNGGIKISKIEKIKPVLFTTEDGKEIFEGDTIFPVTDTFELLSTDLASRKDVGVRCFLIKEEAEEFVVMHKPCLSINDVKSISTNITEDNPFGLTAFLQDRIIELVKNKLK